MSIPIRKFIPKVKKKFCVREFVDSSKVTKENPKSYMKKIMLIFFFLCKFEFKFV